MNKWYQRGAWALLSLILLGQLMPASLAVAAAPENEGEIAITEKTFPDAKFRQWLTNSANLNGYGADGRFTSAELADIRKIDVSDQGISSLEGIEIFTELEQLGCKNNLLTTLDVSQNSALKYLQCAFNRLETLDVSGLDKLISLNCENNYITSLNLTGCTALEIIYCRSNRLPEVDFSTNTNLKFIETFDNQLTEVDLSMLSKLEFVHLDHNRLTHLDLSANTNLSPVGSGFVARNNFLDTLTLPVKADLQVESDVYAEQDPKVGYERVEWYMDASFSQPVPDPVAAQGQTLYAKWLPNEYTIFFASNGGSGSMTSQAALWDQPIALAGNKFQRRGYDFAGWQNTYGNGAVYSDGQSVKNLAGKIQGDRVTLYAQWKPIRYTVAFSAGTGSGVMDEQSFTYDEARTLPECTLTPPEGKEFAGWALEPNGIIRYRDGASVRNLTDIQGETITLYAIWREPIINQYLARLEQAFAKYHAESYTNQDWAQMASIRDSAVEELAGAGDDSQMEGICFQAEREMTQVPTVQNRVQEAVDRWEEVYGTVIGKIDGNAVDESNAAEIQDQTQKAMEGLTPDFVGQYTDLSGLADQERVAGLSAEATEPVIRGLTRLGEAAAWAGTLDGLSNRALAEVTSQWQGTYETACSAAAGHERQLSTQLTGALQARAALALQKQQAVTQLHMEYRSYDLSRYSEQGQAKLESIVRTGTQDIETAASGNRVTALLEKAGDELRAVPDKEQEKQPGGSTGGGAGGGAGGGGAVEEDGTAKPETSGTQTAITLPVTPTLSGDTAKAEVSAGMLDQAVKAVLKTADQQGTKPVVRISADSGEAKAVELTLPAAGLRTLGGDKDAIFIVSTGAGTIQMDAAALSAAANQTQGEALLLLLGPVSHKQLNPAQQAAVGEQEPVFTVSLTSGSATISDLNGGNVKLSLPHVLSAGQQGTQVRVDALDEQGMRSACKTSYDPAAGQVCFESTYLSKYVIGYHESPKWENPFVDVSENSWYFDAVRYASLQGLMLGTSASTFTPDGTLTRAELAQILYNLEGRPELDGVPGEYSDVISGAWYENAVLWAAESGILSGYGGGRMGPGDPITREQLALMLFRYAGRKGYDTGAAADLSGYTDAGDISAYAVQAVQWANAHGIVGGTSAATLTPGGSASRAQAAAMLMRFCENLIK